MLTRQTLNFLKDLKENNDRKWFNKHKSDYQTALENFNQYYDVVVAEIAQFDDKIAEDIENSKHKFRIYRDIRFSKDKTPYKTHFGAMIVPGKKAAKPFTPGYYVHIEPNNTGYGAGMHMPDTTSLKKIRLSILNNSSEYKALIEKLSKQGLELIGEDSALKSAPRGFDKTDPNIDLVKLKSYFVYGSMSDKELLANDAIDKIVFSIKQGKLLNDFLYDSLNSFSL